jgi:hypothetical protein
MGEVVWIEVLSRHRDVIARHRCADDIVRIGRAYDNDVVIDDPYVAPHHARIVRDPADGGLVVEDLGSLNGLFVDREPARRKRLTLHDDLTIRIGHTRLRVRTADHPVAPERPARAETRQWPLLAGLIGAAVALAPFAEWLTDTAEPKPSRYLLPLLGLAVIVLAWTAIWAVLSRVFSGQAQFERNLAIAIAGILGYWLYRSAVQITEFGLAWRGLAPYEAIGMWCLIALLVFLHLRVIGPARPWLTAAAVSALAGAAITMHIVNLLDPLGGVDQTNLLRNFMPPALRLTALRSEGTFFGEVRELKARLDHDRATEFNETTAREPAPPHAASSD